MSNITKTELLAPAGSVDIGIAALNNGADAVYIGGKKFGARASAISTTEDNFSKLINHAHKLSKKVFITINTLFKEKELDELISYTDTFKDVDAFIIQDLGITKLLKDRYKDIELHASTQVGIGDINTLYLMKDLGFSRVILRRELPLNKIKEICKEAHKIGLTVEAFIHGSMCYCISGQCLMSSFIGGLSGNRGRCNAPCRHEYFINDKETHILRMKDMGTIPDIGNLIDAGVDSFKIEGRLRSENYVTTVVKTYRKYIDMYKENSKVYFEEVKKMRQADEKKMQETSNKGGFTNYLYFHNSKKMINV